MARPSGGTELPVEGVLARIKRGAAYAFTGDSDWFGPGQPQPATAPEAVEGRQWQVPIGVNTVQTKKTEGIDFHTLRVFADAVDIIRLLIEERKDQLCALDWAVQKKGTQHGLRKAAAADSRALSIEAFLQLPDQSQPWHQWLRLLLEDMYVLDAASLYVQQTKGGKLFALHPIDGGTIKRLIDGRGWTPQAPLPAYQQILRGVVATDYTTENLLYLARNRRTNRIYGYSHVEQIIVAARLWLARQASNLEYYDKGSVPDGFLSASKDWGPNEIERYQRMLDEQLSGQLGERRKIKIIPNDSKFTGTKEPALKGDYDEWLARIACFCFSVPPIPFIKEMTRATADQSASQSQSGGLEYDRKWVERVMTAIIGNQLASPEYEFVFRDQEAQDPLERAQVDQIYISAGVLMPDEVRGDLGLQPLPDGQGASPRQPVTPGAKEDGPDGDDDEEPEPAGKAAHDHLHKGAPDPLTPAMQRLAESVKAALDVLRERVLTQASAVHKAAGLDDRNNPDTNSQPSDEWWMALPDTLDLSGLTLVYDDLRDAIVAESTTAGRHEIARLAVTNPSELSSAELFGTFDPKAAEWATQHAGELIASDGNGGELADATRDMLRQLIATTLKDNGSRKDIIAALRDAYAFSEQRAELIAQTEIRNAQGGGGLIGAQVMGMQEKRWLLSNDEGICPLCEANADQQWIPIGQAFASGAEHPLQHPRCRCNSAYRRKVMENAA